MWVSEEEWSRPVQQTPEVACVGCWCGGAHHDAAFNPAAGKSDNGETEKNSACSKWCLYALQGMTIAINSGRSVSVASVRRCCRVCWVGS